MQIQFDPRDPNACAAVLAAIIGLHGELPHIDRDACVTEPAPADTTDAAQAFDTPAAPPAPPVPPKGDADDSDDEPATPAVPVAAPGDDPDESDDTGNATVAGDQSGTPATNANAAPAGVETDKDGLPWDARIHSGPEKDKPKNADGTWRRKRGMGGDDQADFVKGVEAELRQIMAAGGNAPAPSTPPAPVAASPEPAPAPAPPAAPAAPVPTPPDAGTASGPVVATTADNTPPPPVAPAPAPTPAAPPATPPATPPAEPAGEMTFPALMRQITALQSSGALTVQATNEIAVSLGLTSVRDLVHRPDMVASFAALLPDQAAA